MAQSGETFFMSAVGFKPPHKGHIKMIKEALISALSKGANYKLFMGRKDRDGVTLDQSIQTLKIFLNDAGIPLGEGSGELSVEATPDSSPTSKKYGDNPKNIKLGRVGKTVHTSSPFQPLLNFAQNFPENSFIVVPTSSEDPKRGDILKSLLSKSRPDLDVETFAVETENDPSGGGKLSATAMRESINSGNFENFKTFIPESSLHRAEEIWTEIFNKEINNSNDVAAIEASELTEMIIEELCSKVKRLLKEDSNLLLEPDEETEKTEETEEDAVEEVSSGAGGNVAGHMGTRDIEKPEETLVREVYNYLLNVDIFTED